MGLFGKKNKMTYDEALNILIDGTSSPLVLKDAYKCVTKPLCDTARSIFHSCLGNLCGVVKNCGEATAKDDVFGVVCFSLSGFEAPETNNENLKLLERLLRRRPDFNREVNEFAMSVQPDYKNYNFSVLYLALAYLYGWGFASDIEKAEEYAKKAKTLGEIDTCEALKKRIENEKNDR